MRVTEQMLMNVIDLYVNCIRSLNAINSLPQKLDIVQKLNSVKPYTGSDFDRDPGTLEEGHRPSSTCLSFAFLSLR